MEFVLSHHAKEQIELRGIFERDVFLTLENPDKIEFDEFGQFVYQKIFSIEVGKKYMLRVFVNSNKNPKLIKTVYLTSKINKYL